MLPRLLPPRSALIVMLLMWRIGFLIGLIGRWRRSWMLCAVLGLLLGRRMRMRVAANGENYWLADSRDSRCAICRV